MRQRISVLPFHKSPPRRFYQQASRQLKGSIISALTAINLENAKFCFFRWQGRLAQTTGRLSRPSLPMLIRLYLCSSVAW